MTVKVFATAREKLYSATAESQAIKERAPLTLVALVVKMANAMAEVAKEKGIDLQGGTPAVRAKLLQAVFDELLAGSFIKELDYCFFCWSSLASATQVQSVRLGRGQQSLPVEPASADLCEESPLGHLRRSIARASNLHRSSAREKDPVQAHDVADLSVAFGRGAKEIAWHIGQLGAHLGNGQGEAVSLFPALDLRGHTSIPAMHLSTVRN